MRNSGQGLRVMAAVEADMRPFSGGADYTPPEDKFTDMRRHITPRIRALAAAEWAAMDDRGRLPDDWPERRAEIERRFAEPQP